MALDPKEVKCRLDPDLHEAFRHACEIKGVGLAEMGEQLIRSFVDGELHDYIKAKNRYEGLGYLGKIRDLWGKAD